MTTQTIDIDKMVFRKTHLRPGRNISVSPANSAMRHLAYGRIILNSAEPFVKFETSDRETGFVCMSGEAEISVDGSAMRLGKYDSLYIPRDSKVEVRATSSVDIAEFSADVGKKYPLKLVHYADVVKDPGLRFETGAAGSTRKLNILLAKNVEAGRLIAGLTHSEPGNWTSWPPHEHAKMLEELYVYVDMPHPAYGIQLVYNDTEYPELVTIVREGDAVIVPSGYHPNVSIPGHPIGFLWAMAAHREGEDRQFGVVNVQPDFNRDSSGLEAGKKK
jgi:5-deoxy-glucuronate isomerase